MALGRESKIVIPTVTGQAAIDDARASAKESEMKGLQPKLSWGEWIAEVTKGNVKVKYPDQTPPAEHTEFKE